jgi:hypothetical protein
MSSKSPLFFVEGKAFCPKGPGGLPTIESLVALVKHLTGRAPSELEVLEARMKLEQFLAERAAEQAAISPTPVAPANSQPRPSTEEEDDAAEASQSHCDALPTK